MNQELKPCPFCGGDAEHLHIYPTEDFVHCVNVDCNPRPSVWGSTEAEAITAWNKRAQPAGEAELVAHLPFPWRVSQANKGVPGATYKPVEVRAANNATVVRVGDDDAALPLANLIVSLAAPPAAANQAGMWQPIETAPKWKEVLVWREDSGPFIAKLIAPEDVCDEEADAHSWADPSIPAWLSDAYGWQEGSERPTHWMPLPAAPHAESHALGGGDD